MTNEQSKFLVEIESISPGIAEWCQIVLQKGWTLAQVKDRLIKTAMVAGRK